MKNLHRFAGLISTAVGTFVSDQMLRMICRFKML